LKKTIKYELSKNKNNLLTKMAVFWVVAPFSVVEVYRRFRGACCLHHQGDDEAESTSEMPVNSYQITWRNIPKDSHLITYVCNQSQ
jgi:hypothetical protein